MRPLCIGLDLDGVIVNSVPRWIAVLNREAGTSYGPDNLPDSHGTPDMAAISDHHELDMLIPAFPVPGAVAALDELRAAGHRLVAITARHPRLRAFTEAWLAYHGIAVDSLHMLQGASKAPVAQAEGVDIFVEDAPHGAQALAAAGVPTLLFAAPYNQGVSHPLITRVDGWPAVRAQICTLAGCNEQSA